MSSLTSIRNCTDRIEAESLRIRLAEAGIRALVTGTDMETALGLGGAGTMRMVRLEVPTEDAERAVAILEEDRRKAIEAGPWICSRCHEQNESTFEVCWSCSKPRSDDDERGRLEPKGLKSTPEPIEIERTEPVSEDGNPYRPAPTFSSPQRVTGVDSITDESWDTIDADVRRAFRASIVGSFVFPPLVCFYSLYLLLSIPGFAYQKKRNWIFVTWVINFLLIFAWTAWWLSFFRR
ncbi:MAG: DUF2007 domain-containing protein [Planctomycetota bacterium]